MTTAKAKSLFKKFEFLLSLDAQKSNTWIWENVCENDFLSLMEGLIHFVNKEEKLELVDGLLEGFSWNSELTSITETMDFTSSDAAKKLTQSYGQAGLEMPKEMQEFEKYVLSGVSMKDIFYTKIFPGALKNENSSEFFGYDKGEISRIADLRFANTLEGFEAMKTEYKALESNISASGKSSICTARKYRKRKLEIEFMYCFLMNLKNS